jgi:glycosyltransferase involved in cell wall biosynthesis
MRVCLAYDCLFPYTVGGAERWYRNLADRLARAGHEVTYLTLRQWERGDAPRIEGVDVVAVGPRASLYARGRRRIGPTLRFGEGVLRHLLAHGDRYDAVHIASFPYFSVLAAGVARRRHGFRLFVDWHEVWTRAYWREYLGAAGSVGWAVQRACIAIPHRAFCFSRLHERRLLEEGFRGEVTVLGGEYAGPLDLPVRTEPGRTVVYAGRHIPEKRVPAVVDAVAWARERVPDLGAAIFGDGPQRVEVLARVRSLALDGAVDVPGFVEAERVDAAIAEALCLVLPSRREGYGLVVVEACAHGTPAIVVSGPDNAATELIEEGENGFVAASAAPEVLGAAILRVREGGAALRASTAAWFRRNARRLSIESSLETVLAAYGSR